MEQIYYLVSLSDMDRDREIIGGPREMVIPLITRISSYKNMKINKITKEEAITFLKNMGCVGAGSFITNPYNLISNENRRLLAKDLLVYIGKRIGSTIIWEPLELTTNLETDRESIKENNIHLTKYYGQTMPDYLR